MVLKRLFLVAITLALGLAETFPSRVALLADLRVVLYQLKQRQEGPRAYLGICKSQLDILPQGHPGKLCYLLVPLQLELEVLFECLWVLAHLRLVVPFLSPLEPFPLVLVVLFTLAGGQAVQQVVMCL